MIALHRQAGLTLLELVVTMLVLTIITGVAIRATSGLRDQTRYEQTRERLDMIRDAIVKVERVNGRTVVSGFLADMGRLPSNLHELLAQEYCPDRRYTTTADCNTALGPGSWVSLPAPEWDATSGLPFGWLGPYLRTSRNPGDDAAFADGWGNSPIGPTDQTYGWQLDPNPPTTGADLTVTSLGANGRTDATLDCGDLDYAGDCAIQVPATNQQITVTDGIGNGGILVRLTKPSAHADACTLPIQDAAVCTTLGGTWLTDPPAACASINTLCNALGGAWDLPTLSCNGLASGTMLMCGPGPLGGCSNAGSVCTNLGGTWDSDTGKCNSADLARAPCTSHGGTWTAPPHAETLCLRLYRRQSGTIAPLDSNSVSVKADGGQELRVFGFAPNTAVTVGAAAAAVHRYDATATPPCTDVTEPQNRSPVPLMITRGSSLPIVEWSLE